MPKTKYTREDALNFHMHPTPGKFEITFLFTNTGVTAYDSNLNRRVLVETFAYDIEDIVVPIQRGF